MGKLPRVKVGSFTYKLLQLLSDKAPHLTSEVGPGLARHSKFESVRKRGLITKLRYKGSAGTCVWQITRRGEKALRNCVLSYYDKYIKAPDSTDVTSASSMATLRETAIESLGYGRTSGRRKVPVF